MILNHYLMRRVLIALACLLALAGCLVVPGASAPSFADAASKTITMGTSPDYPPYENVDAAAGGDIVGLDIDIAKAIADKLGFELKIAPSDFDGLIAALQSNRVDFVMSGMSVTEERKKSVDFSDTYYTASNMIVSLSNSGYDSLEQLAGKKVGVQLGSTQEKVVSEIETPSVLKLNKIPDLIQALKAHRVDAIIVEDAVAAGYAGANKDLKIAAIPAGEEGEGYAIAFPKGSDLTEPFNQALQEMKEDGSLQLLIDKWFGTESKAGETETNTGGSGGGLHFNRLEPYMGYIFKGVYVTLLFTLVSAAFGFVWGAILSLFKLSKSALLRGFSTVYTSVFRGTPLLLQLALIYYAVPQLTGYNIPALLAAGLAFGLNSAAYLSETIRGGIMAVDKGQREAAMSLGIPYRTMMFSIIMPQAVKNILPALVNECVALVKESSLVSVIGVADLMRRATVVQANTFLAFEPLLIVGAIYYILVLALTSVARLLERRMRRSD